MIHEVEVDFAGRPLKFQTGKLAQLADAARWRFVEHTQVGEDLRLRLRPRG